MQMTRHNQSSLAKLAKSPIIHHSFAKLHYNNSMTTQPELRLPYDFTFTELLNPEGLHRLDKTFLAYLHEQNPELHTSLVAYRR